MLQHGGDQHATAMQIPAVRQRNLAADVDVHAAVVGDGMWSGGRDAAQDDGDRKKMNDGPPHSRIAVTGQRRQRESHAHRVCSRSDGMTYAVHHRRT